MAGTLKRISTHVLDTSRGKPSAGVAVRLDRRDASGAWTLISKSKTDSDGRCGQLLAEDKEYRAGEYRIVFETGHYFRSHGADGLYPYVEIAFVVHNGEAHYHIPLLLSPNGYTTYRGS